VPRGASPSFSHVFVNVCKGGRQRAFREKIAQQIRDPECRDERVRNIDDPNMNAKICSRTTPSAASPSRKSDNHRRFFGAPLLRRGSADSPAVDRSVGLLGSGRSKPESPPPHRRFLGGLHRIDHLGRVGRGTAFEAATPCAPAVSGRSSLAGSVPTRFIFSSHSRVMLTVQFAQS